MRFITYFTCILPVLGWNLFPSKPQHKRPVIYVNPWDYKQFRNTKFISTSPGGIFGFYNLGIATYLLENYDLNNYSFIGASAGAWTSLFCVLKKNHTQFIQKLLTAPIFDSSDSVSSLQYELRNHILNNYNDDDFDLTKLYICISEIDSNRLQPNIVSNLTTLEKAIDCCIISSHIPYITSDKLIQIYDEKISFDGGLFPFPPKSVYNHFVIHPGKYNLDVKVNSKMLINLITNNIFFRYINDFI